MEITTVQRMSPRSKFGLYPRDEVLEMTKDNSIHILQMQNALYGFFIVEYREIKKEEE